MNAVPVIRHDPGMDPDDPFPQFQRVNQPVVGKYYYFRNEVGVYIGKYIIGELPNGENGPMMEFELEWRDEHWDAALAGDWEWGYAIVHEDDEFWVPPPPPKRRRSRSPIRSTAKKHKHKRGAHVGGRRRTKRKGTRRA
jgi:hypothetical protein